jgi:transposase, IS5 family
MPVQMYTGAGEAHRRAGPSCPPPPRNPPRARGHYAPNLRRVFISGQKRGVFGRIKRELRRRSAIEAVIGHMKAEGHLVKAEGHLGRCYLKGHAGDAANVILSAVGSNLRVVLAWLRMILPVVLLALLQIVAMQPALKPTS